MHPVGNVGKTRAHGGRKIRLAGRDRSDLECPPFDMKTICLLTVWFLASLVPGTRAATNHPTRPRPPAMTGADQARRVIPDPRVRDYIMPQRIVWISSTNGVEVKNPQSLLVEKSGQVTLDAHQPCVLRSTGGQPGVLLDFGTELSGGVQIMVWNTEGGKPVRLRVRFGESVSEAMSEIGGDKNATNDHAVRDQTCLVPWLGTHEIGNTGFRFLRLDLVETNRFVELKLVRAVFIRRAVEYLGSFRCNDERLNQIWATGAYTVLLNMQDYLWDGIKRDRLVWIGDMHPETMTLSAVFGANDLVPRSLDLIRDETPLPKWMNGISSYSMWWVLIQQSWYQLTGDAPYLRQQRAYLTGLLRQLANCVGPDHQENLPRTRFLDWPSSANQPAIHAGLHALLVLTLNAGAELCGVLNDPATQQLCRDTVASLKQHRPDPAGSKQAAALLALAGLEDAARLNREVMAVDGPRRMSTFYGYYVLQARALAGDYQGCLDCIRQYWGGMLDAGATTFWEDFDLAWLENAGRIDELTPPGKKDIHGDYGNYCYLGFRHSLCHGWASGPTAWLSEHVLGVQVVAPGCQVVRVHPHLGDLQWVEGTYPTPRGILKIKHIKQPNGSVQTSIDAPPGVRVQQD